MTSVQACGTNRRCKGDGCWTSARRLADGQHIGNKYGLSCEYRSISIINVSLARLASTNNSGTI